MGRERKAVEPASGWFHSRLEVLQGTDDSRDIEGYCHQPAQQGQKGLKNPVQPPHQPAFQLAHTLSQPAQFIPRRKLRPVPDVRNSNLRLRLGHIGLGKLLVGGLVHHFQFFSPRD